MNMDNLLINELVYDHYGTYVTVCSDPRYKSTDTSYIFSDIEVGANSDENYIVDTGMSNDRNSNLFVNYCSLHSEDPVTESRCHAVYTRCTMESLHEIERLLHFPFCDSKESRELVSRQISFDASERINRINTALRTPWNDTVISKDKLKALVCYIYKKKSLKADRFIYIIVPEGEVDYSAYCLLLISAILRALPVGMRKGLRFATNAKKDDNYSVLFVRKKNLNSDAIGCSVDLSQPGIPAFILDHRLDKKLEKLIEDCVESPQDSGEGNMVDACYEDLELGIIKDVRNITEKHYKDQIEILELRKKEITKESVKEFSDKLGASLAKEQREALEKQILRSFPNTSRLERVLKSAQDEVNVCTLKEYFDFLADYRNLILELKKNGVFLSKEYFDNRMDPIHKFFFMSISDDGSAKAAENYLQRCRAWEKDLKDQFNSIKEYFREEYYKPIATNAQENTARWEDELYARFFVDCNESIKDDFSVDKIRKILNRFSDKYPSHDKKLELCREVIGEVAECRKTGTNVTDYIHVVKESCKEVEIPSELYSEYEKETIEAVLSKPSVEIIRNSANEVKEYFGDAGERQFRSNLSSSFETQLSEKKWTEEKLDTKSYDIVFAIVNELNTQGQPKRTQGDSSIQQKGRSYLKNRIVNKFGELIRQSTYDKKAIEDQIAAVSKYLGADTALYNSANSEIINAAFSKMKQMAELDYDDSAEEARDKKEKIDYLYETLENNKLLSKEVQEWYAEWKNTGKIIIRRKELEEEVDNLTEYLYVCKMEPKTVDPDVKKNLQEKVVKSGRTASQQKMYSVNGFLAAVSYVEQIPAESIFMGDVSDKRTKFYRTEFSAFQKMEPLPIVLYKGMSLETVYSYLQCFEKLNNHKNDLYFVYKKKKKIRKIEANLQQVKEGINAFISLCLGKAVETDETRQKILNDSAFFERGDQLWLSFREAGVLDDYYLNALRNSPASSAERIKSFFRHIDKQDSSVKNAKLMKKILTGLGVFAIALIMFAAGFGVKGLMDPKDEKSIAGLTESKQESTAGMSSESSSSEAAKETTESASAAETGKTQQNESTQKEDRDNDSTATSAVEEETGEESLTGNGESELTEQTGGSEEANSEEQSEYNEEDEAIEEVSEENPEGVQGKIRKADQPVEVYKSRKMNSDLIARTQSVIEVTILDSNFREKGNNERIKIRFNKNHRDMRGNQVQKGQVGYVLKKYLQIDDASDELVDLSTET